MKLLFFSTVHPSPAVRTRGTFNLRLLESLRAIGHDVRALVPVPWHEAPALPSRDGANVEYCRFWFPPRVVPGLLHKFLGWSVRKRFRSMTRDWHPDFVVGYWTHPDGTVALELARSLGVPGILIVGGTDINERAFDRSRQRVIRETLRRADAVFAVGPDLATKVRALGVPAGRVRVLERGVDREVFHPGPKAEARARLGLPESERMLLWIGRMVPVKGLDVLLAALAKVPRESRPVLYLVGGGSEENRLRSLAEELVLTDHVHWVGPTPHAALGDWYRAADLVVLPSRSEGVPNVLLEALACGTPFVASDVGGIGSIASSRDWLVPPEDPEVLAGAISRSLELSPTINVQSLDEKDAARRFADALVDTVVDTENSPIV